VATNAATKVSIVANEAVSWSTTATEDPLLQVKEDEMPKTHRRGARVARTAGVIARAAKLVMEAATSYDVAETRPTTEHIAALACTHRRARKEELGSDRWRHFSFQNLRLQDLLKFSFHLLPHWAESSTKSFTRATLASLPARLVEKFDSILLTLDVRLDFPVMFMFVYLPRSVQVTLLSFARHGTLTHTNIRMRQDFGTRLYAFLLLLGTVWAQRSDAFYPFLLKHLLALYLFSAQPREASSWTDLIPTCLFLL
jgi:hypothetical protein